MLYEVERAEGRGRFAVAFERIERIYLRLLRAVILIIATVMILVAAWLAISSLYKMSRSTEAVEEKVASVEANELINAQVQEPKSKAAENAKPSASPAQRRFYSDFVRRYYGLYRARFEPFRQADDKQLSRDEFDDNFVGSEARLEGIANNDVDFAQDSTDLRNLLAAMTEAAEMPLTRQRLDKYRSARKIQVQHKVEKTRTEYRRGWDSYSTSCEGWYVSPMGCPVQRPVQVPYVETVTSLEFPEGTQSHTDIFRAFQDRYFTLLGQRRRANAAEASTARQDIERGQAEGSLSLVTALQILGGFLMLMFFFLLIAIERHQRRMATLLAAQ